MYLTKSMNAWGTPAFRETLKREIEQLEPACLPLQRGLRRSSYVTDIPHTAVVIGVAENGGLIRAKLGIFYSGIVAGCSCADDPTPVTEENEYCEVQVDIDRATGAATVMLLDDSATD
jgi:hypothetical protein